jgi:predicted transcriptional regulator
MPRDALLLAVRPRFAERILAGTKTAELRRVRPSVRPGQDVLIYSSSPTMALLGAAVVERVETDRPSALWERVRCDAGVTRSEYRTYFLGAERAAAIWLTDIRSFEEPLALSEIRERWPWFRVPQSYSFVRVGFTRETRRIRSLAPRGQIVNHGSSA